MQDFVKIQTSVSLSTHVMNTLTSVVSIPYLSNVGSSTGLPSRYHEDKFTVFEMCISPH